MILILCLSIYGACSEKFNDFLKKIVKAAAEVNHVPYSVLLKQWRNRFSVTLQTFNVRIITRLILLYFLLLFLKLVYVMLQCFVYAEVNYCV